MRHFVSSFCVIVLEIKYSFSLRMHFNFISCIKRFWFHFFFGLHRLVRNYNETSKTRCYCQCRGLNFRYWFKGNNSSFGSGIVIPELFYFNPTNSNYKHCPNVILLYHAVFTNTRLSGTERKAIIGCKLRKSYSSIRNFKDTARKSLKYWGT